MTIAGSVIFSVTTLAVVWYNDETEKARRHGSIEKDIQRERQRAEALGRLPEDDGFAEQYLRGKQSKQL